MVGSVGAVDARGASELGDDGDHCLAPGVAHVGLDGRQRAVERPQEIGELTGRRTLVDVGVPAVDPNRADPRAVGARQIFRRSDGDIGEILAHARDAGDALVRGRGHRADAAGAPQLQEVAASLERPCELCVGVKIKVEKARLGSTPTIVASLLSAA